MLPHRLNLRTSSPVAADSPSRCPACHADIASQDINITEGVAFCRSCHKLLRLKDVIASADDEALREAAKDEPPDGCWASDDGTEIIIGASARSLGGALGALAVTLFWNGIVSVFVVVAIAGTLLHTIGFIPNWFPSPNVNGGPTSSMSLGMTIFLWIFLTPFILVGLGMFGAFLVCVGGRTEVRIRDDVGTVFTGIGPLGWNRRFSPSLVRRVALEDHRWRDSDGDPQRRQQVVIEADKVLRFGTMLTEERRRFLAGMLMNELKR
jgi:hypothetical protein